MIYGKSGQYDAADAETYDTALCLHLQYHIFYLVVVTRNRVMQKMGLRV
jgi:hypothetical protein